MEAKIEVVMCCSDPNSVKGGMVSVVSNYLKCTDFKKSHITFVATHKDGNRLTKSIYFARAFTKIWIMLLHKKPDIMHLHMAERGSFYRKAYIVRACHYFNVPVIIHHHGAEFEDFYENLSVGQKDYVRKIIETADCNLVLSSFLERKLLEKAPRAKVAVLHNAVPVKSEIPDKTAADRIVMLGCQGKRKGSYDLLDAIAAIKDKIPPDITMWMCGDEDVNGVKEYIKNLGLSDRVAWVGWISGEEKEKCLEKALLHILPSYREALPMSILETMGRGIPNISTNIASIPEVIQDGQNGFLIHPGDVNLLQDRILALLENKTLYNDFSQKSYQTIKNEFSLTSCVGKLEEIYDVILQEHSN